MLKCRASQCVAWICLCASFVLADKPRLYTGEIQIPTLGALGMTLGISETEEGIYLLLTVPSQGASDIPLKALYNQHGFLFAELPQANLSFEVMENEDQSKLSGTMLQGLEFPIDFTRIDEVPTLARPQTPTEPYPYVQREVTTMHPDGFLLQGTLTIPEGLGPFPCAVLISGSGQQDRNEFLMGHKPFLIISDYLTRYGIAVLRYDDRGVGGSKMEDYELLSNATSEDFAGDATLMVEVARLHEEIDSRRVGVIGHSEGGLIGPMVAVHDDSLAFVVMLAGPGVPGDEIVLLQNALSMQAMGVEQSLIDSILHEFMTVHELIESNASNEELLEPINELVRLQLEMLEQDLSEELIQEAIKDGLEVFISNWMQFFLTYDPAPTLEQVTCPVLAMNGSKDLQVDANQNLSVIASCTEKSGVECTIVELEGLNHLFQPTETGLISEYGQIEITFDVGALEIMRDWLLEVTDVD